MIKKFFKKSKTNLQGGFSLLEMVMVLSIFAMLTAVVTYNYGTFNNQITLTNLAYEIAMQVREAQVYSLGVKGANNTFDSRYGVYFKTGQGSFISFIDRETTPGVADGRCDANNSTCDVCKDVTECQQIISLPRNMIVEKFVNISDPDHDVDMPESKAYITFKRPDTEAILYKDSSIINSGGLGIVIKSLDGQRKKIVVKKNGYISVDDYRP